MSRADYTRPHAAKAPKALRLTQLPPPKEWEIQARITRVLTREIAPPTKVSKHGVVWWSIDISSYHGVAATRMLRGIMAGVPDMFFLFQGRAFFIELKRPELGEMSDHQCEVASAILVGGGRVGVACNEEQVLALLDAWQVPRAKAVHLM